jgi:L,D-transpeptidase-like protein
VGWAHDPSRRGGGGWGGVRAGSGTDVGRVACGSGSVSRATAALPESSIVTGPEVWPDLRRCCQGSGKTDGARPHTRQNAAGARAYHGAMGQLALAMLALGCVTALVGCRAEQAAQADPPREHGVAAPPVSLEAEPATTPELAHAELVAAPPTPAAPAPSPGTAVAAPSKPPQDAPPAGCIDRVEDLPSSPAFDPDDRRLRRSALVVVSKRARRLMLYDRGHAVACYRVALGFAPEGHKLVQGDGRTPEGWYRTSDKPWSSFENAIAIHYPNAGDAREAADDGRITPRTRDTIALAIDRGRVPPQATALGGAVLIHGGGSSSDWTLGCVALDDAELVELRGRLPEGMRTDLLILP